MQLFGLKKDVKEFNLRVLKQRNFAQRIVLGYSKFLLERIKGKRKANLQYKNFV